MPKTGASRGRKLYESGMSPNASPQTDPSAQLHILPSVRDPLAYLAQLVIERNQASLPDLTNTIVLLSQARAAPWFRRELLRAAQKAGTTALIGPQIDTPSTWVKQTLLPDTRIVADETRELMLVEALLEHPDLYGQGSPYSLASSLLELFDEMTNHYVSLPHSLAAFQQQLETAYGSVNSQLSALDKEATVVHTLWQAMRQQLQSLQAMDQATAYIKQLTLSLTRLSPGMQVYLLGFNDFTLAEWQWLQQLAERASLTLIVQGDRLDSGTSRAAYEAGERYIAQLTERLSTPVITPPTPTDIVADSEALSHCINSVYATDTPLKPRAVLCGKQYPHDPIGQHLRVYEASHNEAEANAVDMQVRRWLAQGLSHIGIVTENRRLARRLRALLERAGIVLQDAAGWALSTTSAATVIERWLQCIEEDFHHVPFLDLLKSPFLVAGRDRHTYLQTVYYLEKSVIIDENIAAGLQRYRLRTNLVRGRLNDTMASYLGAIPPLLDLIEQAAQPLASCINSRLHTPHKLLHALLQSLQSLGITELLRQDPAGSQLLSLFDRLLNATQGVGVEMHWVEFRAWLGSHLENAFFQPSATQGPVQLMSLSQSDIQQFDALIIAGAEQQYLPGSPPYSPFFNDAVRADLGIPTVQQKHAGKFYYFRRLLQSTHHSKQPRILITWTRAQNDEELIPSPWLEAIQSFHHLAYRSELTDQQLRHLVANANVQCTDESEPLPQPSAPQPRTTVHPALIPKTMSATSYQQMMNCPYQFFAARCLRLSPPEAVREMLQKDDYGKRIHLCLQAFHSDVPDLPGPFAAPFNEQNKQAAIDLLVQISQQIFAKDIEDNFIHRGWLKRWLDMIPSYVRWQISQAEQWQVYQVELQTKDICLTPRCNIKGQLDRIDQCGDEYKIIDYKTGQVPAKDEVASGEAVQLPFYAMLVHSIPDSKIDPGRVEYLSLDSNRFGANTFIEGSELTGLRQAVANRLADIMDALYSGRELAAWGDSKTCKNCVMSGLCRKGMWSEFGER